MTRLVLLVLSRTDAIEELKLSINDSVNPPDIICITETWLDNNEENPRQCHTEYQKF